MAENPDATLITVDVHAVWIAAAAFHQDNEFHK